MRRRKRQALFGVVSALAAVATALVVASVLGVSVGSGQARSPAGRAGSAHLVGNAASGFSALGNRSLARVPAAVVGELRSLHPGAYADARTVGSGMFLASNDGALCAWVAGGLGGCTDRLNAGDVWLAGDMIREHDSETAPFKVEFYGFARDGVTALEVTTAGGAPRTVPVRNNAFHATFGRTTFADLTAIRVLYASGRTVDVDPARYFAADPPIAHP